MPLTYQNPVWPGYFADPFVLKWRDEYYAYGTGESGGSCLEEDGRVFPMLHSRDLASWSYAGGALEPLTDPETNLYWAPEVAEKDGRFYLYYAADYHLRIAVADSPLGPFRDIGRKLFPDEPFSIDAHPFRDPRDGQWYLFFAKDFFDERVGTGTAVVPLQEDMMTPAAPPRTVLRASADWQLYERNRYWYDRTWDAWHTVEGPFVVEHNGMYYCFYSGGNWQSSGYGIAYGVASQPLGPYLDDWSREGATVLRGVPERVIGPGHNSVVLGPDDQTHYLAYHAWDRGQTARRLCIDPLDWTPQGPRCRGPSFTPQPLPERRIYSAEPH